jgi:Asp-tRNA(Asn)/Glu-tRNA(Gln) amidotransferase A subunit family amidase|tara:strand:+ start:266 stop:1708 length:1443 start_codon:yes stop_codon:yes gene_type:complete
MKSVDLELCYMTATEAIDRFKSKDLSPVELIDQLIARIESTNPSLNAFTYTFFDRARNQATKAENLFAGDKEVRPLEGVPIVIKDYHDVEGEITTYGSRMFEHHVSEKSAPTVQRLLGAGAILLARTTTPEMAYAPMTRSDLWGITRNPWNVDYSPGGSSGGSASAVAAGMTTLADGTDGGGSIRIPSSCTGIFGYKPPFGRNPIDIAAPRESLIHFGPMTRSVDDAVLMQNVTSGPHPDDMCSIRPKYELPSQLEAINGWKIAFSMDLGYYEVDEEVKANTKNALEIFKSLGAEVTEVDVGWNFSSLDAWTTLWEGAFWGLQQDAYPRWKYEMDGFVREILERGSQHSAGRYYRSQLVRGEMYQKLAPILGKYDVLVCPTTALPGIPADHDVERTDFTINGKPITVANRPGDIYVQWQLCYPFNLIPECPVATVPSGFAACGLPTGIQIVGKTFDDLSVFRAAKDYERVYDWRQYRPKI